MDLYRNPYELDSTSILGDLNQERYSESSYNCPSCKGEYNVYYTKKYPVQFLNTVKPDFGWSCPKGCYWKPNLDKTPYPATVVNPMSDQMIRSNIIDFEMNNYNTLDNINGVNIDHFGNKKSNRKMNKPTVMNTNNNRPNVVKRKPKPNEQFSGKSDKIPYDGYKGSPYISPMMPVEPNGELLGNKFIGGNDQPFTLPNNRMTDGHQYQDRSYVVKSMVPNTYPAPYKEQMKNKIYGNNMDGQSMNALQSNPYNINQASAVQMSFLDETPPFVAPLSIKERQKKEYEDRVLKRLYGDRYEMASLSDVRRNTPNGNPNEKYPLGQIKYLDNYHDNNYYTYMKAKNYCKMFKRLYPIDVWDIPNNAGGNNGPCMFVKSTNNL